MKGKIRCCFIWLSLNNFGANKIHIFSFEVLKIQFFKEHCYFTVKKLKTISITGDSLNKNEWTNLRWLEVEGNWFPSSDFWMLSSNDRSNKDNQFTIIQIMFHNLSISNRERKYNIHWKKIRQRSSRNRRKRRRSKYPLD